MIKEQPIRGLCKICNKNKVTKGLISKLGFQLYKTYCKSCGLIKHETSFKYRRWKKNFCEKCGFQPKHPCQLDVDHIDNNHRNNNPENLQTLCANCHRLKTYLSR